MRIERDTPKSVRRSPVAFLAAVTCALCVSLTACGSDTPAPRAQDSPRPQISLLVDTRPLEESLQAQAMAQHAAAEKAAKERAAREEAKRKSQETQETRESREPRSPGQSPGSGGVCTADPADRPNCRNPGGTIDPYGGDLDGDGVYEDHEPVGPGYRDPRAYDGGRTSGETQCDWLRSQGLAC
ncbi:hypothetical protein [Streptomyces vilmorinianum]|uniref:hypothetical protein n=1 Tax=Streptomyces vilmorinianum TaxID=3051092 RepID=UPI0010FB13E6|nr:hypothetical protein [Streptomyces vilmorinianum]